MSIKKYDTNNTFTSLALRKKTYHRFKKLLAGTTKSHDQLLNELIDTNNKHDENHTEKISKMLAEALIKMRKERHGCGCDEDESCCKKAGKDECCQKKRQE